MADAHGAGNERGATTGGLPRWRLWCSGACAAIGVLIVPAVVALVLIAPVIIRGARERRARWVLGGSAIALAALVSAGVGLCAISTLCNQARFSFEAAWLAAAIYRYHESYGRLPDTVDQVIEAGFYPEPDAASRAIKKYLPVDRWDGDTRVVVAVVARKCNLPFWTDSAQAYIVAGDSGAHYVSPQELDEVLAEDNKVREALGEARRWSRAQPLLNSH